MVYAYVRVSTDKQSTETQRFEIKKFSKTKKIHIDRWIDETISGMKGIQNRRFNWEDLKVADVVGNWTGKSKSLPNY